MCRRPKPFTGGQAREPSPPRLPNYRFLLADFRAVPVFFAVDFLAAAVFLAAGFFVVDFFADFLAAAISASLLSGWLVVHSSYIHSSLHTCRI
jgi:hypothetical protein